MILIVLNIFTYNIDHDKKHLLKSLIYFDDVKNSVFPEILKEVSWKEITDEFEKKQEFV